MDSQHTAIYCRVSTRQQDQRSQELELRRWVAAFAPDSEVRWYTDTASGTSMERPGWRELEAAYRSGAVSRIVCWRVDRLGRHAASLALLFDELRELKIPLVSIRDGFDLSTPGGALVATILGSIAQFETSIRGERQRQGIAAAQAQGKRWGGRKPGQRWRVTDEKARQVAALHRAGESVAAISRAVGLSRPTVYRLLEPSTTTRTPHRRKP